MNESYKTQNQSHSGSFVVWRIRSNERPSGRISIVATLQTVCAVAITWLSIGITENLVLALTGLVAVCLVLIRSEKSVRLGAEIYSSYWNSPWVELVSVKAILIAVLPSIGSGLFCALYFIYFSSTHAWSLEFLHYIFIGIFSINIGLAIATTISVRIPRPLTYATTTASVIANFFASMQYMPDAVLPVVIGMVLAIASSLLPLRGQPGTERTRANIHARAIGTSGPSPTEGIGLLPYAMLGLGFCGGLLLRAFLTRMYASLRFLPDGIRSLPRNFLFATLQQSAFSPPELVPGLGRIEPIFEFKNAVRAFFVKSALGDLVLGFFVSAVVFAPAIVYRLIIKSTSWFYCLLVYVVYLPKKMQTSQGRSIFALSQTAKVYEWVRLIVSLFSLTVAILSLLSPETVQEVISASRLGDMPLTVFSLFLVLDFSQIQPWHPIALAVSVLTVFLFFNLDSISKELKAGAEISSIDRRVFISISLTRLRSLLVSIWLVVGFIYFVEYAYDTCRLSEWISNHVAGVFGPNGCYSS
ncbi:hypothetical protein [Meridianimarinicoccus sp. MJW13]|uniref:hypothetical protein n=1 Tax=Meridianimarinicoccus sp. MJW13 TaxID=2720031 RepID=UPI001869161A|nr:hypothetical protein [Fluviibacterium sp. MJW13]